MEYLPLDPNKNEIRVLILKDPPETSSNSVLVECTLEHVSLDDYSDQYKTFLKLDGSDKPFRLQSTLWEVITVWEADFGKYPGKIPNPSHWGSSLAQGFSRDPVYDDTSFRSASVYEWGHLYALSYEWGNQTATAEIVVDGHRVTVTKKLHDALRDLLSWWYGNTQKNKPARLWVDALCINQKNVRERNAQIKLMEQIYGTAASVLIRLGPGLEHGNDKETWELLEEVYRVTAETTATDPAGRAALRAPDNWAAWAGICELAIRPYWKRLWIIQEVFLANSTSKIYFGNWFSKPWTFFKTIEIMQSDYRLISNVYPEMNDNFNLAFVNVQPLLILYSSQNFSDILVLLNAARRAKQADIKDKVYGLLGLMDEHIRAYVTPDYHQSAAEVYRNFAVAVIKATGKLNIIYQTSTSSERALQVPSWVPDWASPSEDGIFYQLAFIEHYYKDATADGGTSHTFIEPENPGHLVCRGFKVGSIATLACSVWEVDHDDHDAVIGAHDGGKPVYDGHEGVKEAIWEVLTYGRSTKAELAVKAWLLDIPYFDGHGAEQPILDALNRFQQCNLDFVVDGRRLASYFPQWTDRYETSPDDPDLYRILAVTMVPLICQRFIITRKGYIGFVSRSAKAGDQVFILKGCNVPLILRPRDDNTYHMVGEGYISGLMNGEAVKGLEAGDYEECDIILS
ncbi:hypothetical protein GGR53DRAFT_493438 [Hypoxylon sp. FL1150]|nr:hypothetical protein GGR53DRAFT_493438 [Hypoxylon sp. FL1150]